MMIDGIPDRPLYFYQKDIIDRDYTTKLTHAVENLSSYGYRTFLMAPMMSAIFSCQPQLAVAS
jgi:hypothetical protein